MSVENSSEGIPAFLNLLGVVSTCSDRPRQCFARRWIDAPQSPTSKHSYSDLSGTAVDEQLNTGDVGAVVGSEEHSSLAEIIGGAAPAERNRLNDGGFLLIRHKMREAGCIGVSGAQHVDTDVAPLEVDDPGASE